MKNFGKTILIAGVALCGAGLVCCGIGGLLGGRKYVEAADLNRINGSAMKEDSSWTLEKTKLDELSSLQADLENVDFYMKESEDESYYISYEIYGSYTESPLTYEVKDGVLYLSENGSENEMQFVNINIDFINGWLRGELNAENSVTLYVPEGALLAESWIEMEYGDMTAGGFQSENVHIEMVYGNLELRDSSLNDGSIALDMGEFDDEDSEFDAMEIELQYGDISLTASRVYGCDIVLDNGDFSGENIMFAREASVTCDYGDVDIRLHADCRQTLNLYLEADYGDIEVGKSLKGESSVPTDENDASHFERSVEEAEGTLTVTADDGDIAIE